MCCVVFHLLLQSVLLYSFEFGYSAIATQKSSPVAVGHAIATATNHPSHSHDARRKQS